MNMQMPVPQLLVDLPCKTGEGPLWHEDEQKVYWVDIPACKLYRCRADGTEFEQFETGAQVGGLTFQADGSLLLFMSRGAVKVWQDGCFRRTVLEEVEGETDSRFNDVIADPVGRVYCGTMSSRSHGGRFYRLDPDGSITLLRENMKTPNGMGFSPDRRYFYQSDSGACEISRFSYDQATGALRDREVIFSTTADDPRGRPDGMTVDSEGFLWSARWDGGRVVRHDPDGEPIDEILFPAARKVSSLTFGGSDWRTAFCTTAGGAGRDQGEGELAGSLFRCDSMPTAGRPEFRSRIGIGS